MNDLRSPYVFEFTDRQAQLMRATVDRTMGHIIRGPSNVSAAKELEDAGLITLEILQKSGPGFILKATFKGREAFHNARLKAGGRQPVCL